MSASDIFARAKNQQKNASMYQRKLRNPDLTKAERHKPMNALSNHTYTSPH